MLSAVSVLGALSLLAILIALFATAQSAYARLWGELLGVAVVGFLAHGFILLALLFQNPRLFWLADAVIVVGALCGIGAVVVLG